MNPSIFQVTEIIFSGKLGDWKLNQGKKINVRIQQLFFIQAHRHQRVCVSELQVFSR